MVPEKGEWGESGQHVLIKVEFRYQGAILDNRILFFSKEPRTFHISDDPEWSKRQFDKPKWMGGAVRLVHSRIHRREF